MAEFVARGVLRFDAVAPPEINAQFLAEMGEVSEPEPGRRVRRAFGELLAQAQIPEVPAGTPLAAAYPQGSAIRRLLDLPLVSGAIQSLVGPDPIFDHHFLHVTFPPAYYEAGGGENELGAAAGEVGEAEVDEGQTFIARASRLVTKSGQRLGDLCECELTHGRGLGAEEYDRGDGSVRDRGKPMPAERQ
eukprot:gene2714-3701_t